MTIMFNIPAFGSCSVPGGALLPIPGIDRPDRPGAYVLPSLRRRPIKSLAKQRIALIGGAGACVSLIGVPRAFEEAAVEPAPISACSGGAIWESMWAAGLSAQATADFSVSWRLAVGEFPIPFTSIVYDMDRGRVDYFGTASRPELPIGRLVHIAMALPGFIESVEVDGHLYVDGGIIDLLPAQPILRDGAFDHVFAVSFMLPPQLEPEDITGWQNRRMGFLRASRPAEQGSHLEFADRMRRALGDTLTVIDASDNQLLRGPAFYDLFIDRSRWPELIRGGYERATAALDAFRPRQRASPGRTPRNGRVRATTA